MLYPAEEELETSWYRTLLMLADNQHSILDCIVNGELVNLAQQIPDNIYVQKTTIPISLRTSLEVGPSFAFAFGASNYVTQEKMEEMLGMHRQHIISDVFRLCDNLKE